LGFGGIESRPPSQISKGCKFPNKSEESIAEAGIVTASVTVLSKKTGLLFLSAQYYSEGEAVMNTVTVMIRAKLNGKYPYLPAVWSGNGRLKPNVAFVNGNEQKVEGQFYLRFTEGGNRHFEMVDGEASDAVVAAQKKAAALKAKAVGVAIVEDSKTDRIKLADAVAEYKSEIKEHKAWATYRAYSTALNLFVRGCKKTYVDEVT
jgi:hypothetical protein